MRDQQDAVRRGRGGLVMIGKRGAVRFEPLCLQEHVVLPAGEESRLAGKCNMAVDFIG
jgi:hypothetical protein